MAEPSLPVEQGEDRGPERRLAAGTHTEHDLLTIISRLSEDLLDVRESARMVLSAYRGGLDMALTLNALEDACGFSEQTGS